MKKLTAINENGKAYYPTCFSKCDGIGASVKCDTCSFNINICETLAAYEATDLTPDKIREIDRLYLEKCKEVTRLETEKKAAIALHKDCVNELIRIRKSLEVRHEDTELKPCPFCGNMPIIENDGIEATRNKHDGDLITRWMVTCRKCGTSKKGGITEYRFLNNETLQIANTDFDGRKKAIKAWNERAAEKEAFIDGVEIAKDWGLNISTEDWEQYKKSTKERAELKNE